MLQFTHYVFLAVLLYLNYKNAYSYWNEQRMSLNEDVCMTVPFFICFHIRKPRMPTTKLATVLHNFGLKIM